MCIDIYPYRHTYLDIFRNVLLQHFKVTRLVPYLEPEQECVLVPREVGYCLTEVFCFCVLCVRHLKTIFCLGLHQGQSKTKKGRSVGLKITICFCLSYSILPACHLNLFSDLLWKGGAIDQTYLRHKPTSPLDNCISCWYS